MLQFQIFKKQKQISAYDFFGLTYTKAKFCQLYCIGFKIVKPRKKISENDAYC